MSYQTINEVLAEFSEEYIVECVNKAALSQQEAVTLDNAPIGTKAPSHTGGYWIRVERGWKWNTGATFGHPGGDWTGELIPPANPQPQKVESFTGEWSVVDRGGEGVSDIDLSGRTVALSVGNKFAKIIVNKMNAP